MSDRLNGSAMAGLVCIVLLLAALPWAASAAAQQLGEEQVRLGRIERIDPVSLEGDHHLGVGMVLGAVAGGVLGHQFGGGTGRDVLTVMGTLGGGLFGRHVQNTYADRRAGQHIIVKVDNGVAVGITQPADPALRVGDRVRIDGSGQDARVIRM